MLLRAMAGALSDDHDIVTACGGAEALAILENDRAFDLIVCDLQMPSVDGVAVHESIARQAPALLDTLVFMTGGAVTPRVQTFLARVHPRVIEKPLDLDALVALASSTVAHRQ
jgi:CheY-like chemotaxis protein